MPFRATTLPSLITAAGVGCVTTASAGGARVDEHQVRPGARGQAVELEAQHDGAPVCRGCEAGSMFSSRRKVLR
jgi:hypothetical protein